MSSHASRNFGAGGSSGALWVVLIFALTFRLSALVLFPHETGITDSETYLAAARDILDGRVFRSELVMPLYPLQAALMGADALALKLSDIVLSVASVWLVHAIALRMFGDSVTALLAALALAAYPFSVFYSVSGLTETSYTFLILLGFALLYGGRLTLGAAVLVLSLLSRPTLEPLLPLLLAAFAILVHRLDWRSFGLLLAKVAVIYLAVMAPWWVHNQVKYDRFVRLNLGDGRMFYLGNNPKNVSGGGIEGVDADLTRFYTEIDDPFMRNQAMKSEAFAYMRENPGRVAKLAILKISRFWRLWPYSPYYQGWLEVVSSVASFGIALVFAVAFLVRNGARHWRVLAPVLLFAAFLTAVHAITLGSIRYRFPIDPFVLILGAAMASRLMPPGLRARFPQERRG